MGVVLKHKVHIIDKIFKVDSFMETVNNNMEIECGTGNNRIVPKPSESISFTKIRNTNPNMKLQIRLAKAGKEKRCINLGPGEECDAVSIIFQGEEAAQYHLEAATYNLEMLRRMFDVDFLKDVNYRNSEQLEDQLRR